MLGENQSEHYTLNWKVSFGMNEKIQFIRKAKLKAINDDFSSVDWDPELTGFNTEQSYSNFHDFTLKEGEPKISQK